MISDLDRKRQGWLAEMRKAIDSPVTEAADTLIEQLERRLGAPKARDRILAKLSEAERRLDEAVEQEETPSTVGIWQGRAEAYRKAIEAMEEEWDERQ